MADYKISLFGYPRVESVSGPVPISRQKQLAALAVLALNRNSTSREHLAAMLWPESTQEKAGANLRLVLSLLRKQISNDALISDYKMVSLNRDMISDDIFSIDMNSPHLAFTYDTGP